MKQRPSNIFSLSFLLGCVVVRGWADGPVAAPDFQREVRPILSRYCFACHGPDDPARKGGLRLDQPGAALQPAKSGELAIVPGKPEASELVRRIFTTDADDLMPPPESKHRLTDAQKDVLKRWIAAGADYQPHWAFVPPRQAPLPAVRQRAWTQNAIDHFVLARLEQEGLKPSPPADDHTLVRRLYLDLIGLPPMPDEVDAFLAAVKVDRTQAIARLVDELLGSPHYGERWARRWLDLARYADTNGYEKDRPRSIWPYRDWVIQALNDDLPFDQFTLRQIAGDLLPGATVEDRVATGFHRNTMLNEEGGIDPLEFRFHAMTDRVATTGTTWLGLTTGCAQCHTHKYDPISHHEYFHFMAFLNNADEPDLDLPDARVEAERKAIEEKLARLITDLPGKFPLTNVATATADQRREKCEESFNHWLAQERAKAVAWQPLEPVSLKANLALLQVQPDRSIFASGDQSKVDTYELTFAVPAGVRSLRLEAIPDDRLPAHGPGATYYEGPKGDFFLGEFEVTANGQKLNISEATESYANNNFGKNPVSAKLATDGDLQTGWSCAGRFGERHEAVFTLASPLPAATTLTVKMTFGRHYACPLGRFRISVTDQEQATARDLPDELQQALLKPDNKLTPGERDTLRQHFLLTTPELARAREEIDQLRKSLPELTTTLVMSERPPENTRPTFRHHRGEFLQPKEPVQPGVIAALHPLPVGKSTDRPPNRLDFAHWLVSPENPLVGRVTVNRQWQAFFGQGLVRTLGDLGLQGESPSHPALLDWLAVEFVKRGWSVKELHRQIVLSATYQQAAVLTPELLARDPENRLLARGPRVRLEAELIRDSALRIAGLLSPKVGGPSVFPPQPKSITTEGSYGKLAWEVSTGGDQYRRGLYTFAKRTTPYAMFATFDAPSGEACIARRDISDTPLQALTLLNDTVFLDAAQAIGRMMAAREGTVSDGVEHLFRRFLARPPTADETERLVSFFHTQRARFAAEELDTSQIAGPGSGDVNERAAWTALARALFNLDELVTKG